MKFLLSNRGKLLDKKMSLAELKMILGEPYFWDLYELQNAIQRATKQSSAALGSLRKRIKALGGKYTRIKDLCLESNEIKWDDKLLDLVKIETLFGDSAEKIVEGLEKSPKNR